MAAAPHRISGAIKWKPIRDICVPATDRQKARRFVPAGVDGYSDVKMTEAYRFEGLQYIRGNPESTASDRAKIFRAGLAAHAVDLGLE